MQSKLFKSIKNGFTRGLISAFYYLYGYLYQRKILVFSIISFYCLASQNFSADLSYIIPLPFLQLRSVEDLSDEAGRNSVNPKYLSEYIKKASQELRQHMSKAKSKQEVKRIIKQSQLIRERNNKQSLQIELI